MSRVTINGVINRPINSFCKSITFKKIDINDAPFSSAYRRDLVVKSISKNNTICIFEDITSRGKHNLVTPTLGMNDGTTRYMFKYREFTKEFRNLLIYDMLLDINRNIGVFKLNLPNDKASIVGLEENENYSFLDLVIDIKLLNGRTSRVEHPVNLIEFKFKAYHFGNRLIGCYEYELDDDMLDFGSKNRITLKPFKNKLSKEMYSSLKSTDFDSFDKSLIQGMYSSLKNKYNEFMLDFGFSKSDDDVELPIQMDTKD